MSHRLISNSLVWSEYNVLIANPSKLQSMSMDLRHDLKLCMEKDEVEMTTMERSKVLGVIMDSKLRFDERVKSFSLTTSRNISVLFEIS